MYGGWTLFQTLMSLKNRTITPHGLPRIDVMDRRGKYYVVNGNRRLYLYKLLEHYGIVQTVPVNVVPLDTRFFTSSKFTTKNDGAGVSIRHMPTLESHLRELMEGRRIVEPIYPTRRRHFYHDDSDSDEFDFGSPYLW